MIVQKYLPDMLLRGGERGRSGCETEKENGRELHYDVVVDGLLLV